MEEHNLIREVGKKSRLEDLGRVECKSFETSVDVTVAMTENCSPEWVGSGNGDVEWFGRDIATFRQPRTLFTQCDYYRGDKDRPL